MFALPVALIHETMRMQQAHDPDRRRRALLARGECPQCRYSIHALPLRRCPECGERWTQAELDLGMREQAA